MTDIVTPKTRSRMMAGIRSKNTKPELLIRRQLHKLGFRFRLHDRKLPGSPDIVLRKYNAIIFINGCFWHCHKCHLFKWPKTRRQFWQKKLKQNHANDQKNMASLAKSGWRICIVWECAMKGPKKDIPGTIKILTEWLKGQENMLEIPK